MRKEIVTTGVVAELEGQYWGEQYSDGHHSCCDFGPIENAKVSDPRYCKRPDDMTYSSDSYGRPRLQKAKLVPVKITTVYEICG